MTERYDPANWPRWAFIACAALIGVQLTIMVAVAERPAVVAPLAVVIAVPWVDHVLHKHPPPWVLLSLSLLPVLALNTVLYDAAGPTAATVATMLVIFVQGEAVSAYAPRAAAAGVLLGSAVLVAHGARNPDLPLAYWMVGSAMAVAVGYLIRKQQETVLELRETQARLVGEATLRERQRIAREVHDVIAHTMTVTMMHVTAARLAVHRDPQKAFETLEDAERLGRSSLAEVRRTVGLLRGDVDRATDRALPTATGIRSLVADSRGAGMDVELEIEGDLDAVDGPEGLAVYRVVQEAIANAAKHATGAPVRVWVAVDDEVRVHVTNPIPVGARRRTGTGNGLAGMRERALLLGGEITAGSDGDRWTVDARLPLPRTDDAEDTTAAGDHRPASPRLGRSCR